MIWSDFGKKWAMLPNASTAGPVLKSYFDTLYVALTGNQTVAGIKTFSSNPVVSGGGIQFPATQVASADANCLDDYEEGTFTPALALTTPGTSSFTYSAQTGYYTKVGRVVHCQGRVTTSGFTVGTGSGNVSITGLPFSFDSSGAHSMVNVSYATGWTTQCPRGGFTSGTAALLYFFNAAGVAAITAANITAGANDVIFTVIGRA